jgi:hypothetical protein
MVLQSAVDVKQLACLRRCEHCATRGDDAFEVTEGRARLDLCRGWSRWKDSGVDNVEEYLGAEDRTSEHECEQNRMSDRHKD